MINSVNRAEKLSYIGMTITVIFWGLAWPVGKIIATNFNGASLTAAFWRFSFAFPALSLVVLSKEKSISVPRKFHPKLVILGFLQVSLYNFLYLTGLRFTSSSDASLIIALNPTLTAVISSQLYRDEKLTLNRVMGLLIAFGGVSLIFLLSPNSTGLNPLLGNFVIFGGALVWATATSFSRPIFKEVTPLRYQFWVTLYGWIALGLLSLFERPWEVTVSTESWFALIYLGLFAAAAANVLFSTGVKHLGPTKTSIFVNFVPLMGLFFSVLILHENFSFIYIIAFVLTTIGVYLVNRKTHRET